MQVSESVLVPSRRVRSVENAKVKFESLTNLSLSFDKNEVTVTGESLDVLRGKKVIIAIARGFSFDKAVLLWNDDVYDLLIFDIGDYANSRNKVVALKGRVIGKEGSTKRFIEKKANVSVCVFGDTISVIGSEDGLSAASNVIDALLRSVRHGTALHLIKDDK